MPWERTRRGPCRKVQEHHFIQRTGCGGGDPGVCDNHRQALSAGDGDIDAMSGFSPGRARRLKLIQHGALVFIPGLCDESLIFGRRIRNDRAGIFQAVPLHPRRKRRNQIAHKIARRINQPGVDPPDEHVVIFDEAQRAWNLRQTASFTRLPSFYDPTFNYLKDLGLPEIV